MSNYTVTPQDMGIIGFGPAFAGGHVPTYQGLHATPWDIPVNPEFVFDQVHAMRILVQAWIREHTRPEHAHRKGVYLHGPTGSGKTTLPEQFFARLGVPVIRCTWSPKREAEEMIASKTIIGGDLLPVDQAIAIAARNGFPVIINEIDLADPAELVNLNDVIEKGLIVLPDGTSFIAERGFFICATANTAGEGDDTGNYHGTGPLNGSTLRRFYSVEVDYPTQEAEAAFLASQLPNVATNLIDAAAKVVTLIRRAYTGTLDGKRLSSPISRPEAVDWIDLMGRFAYLKARNIAVAEYAMGFAFSNRLSRKDQLVVEELIKAEFSSSTSTPGASP
jgi:cobaltochelatase CobS